MSRSRYIQQIIADKEQNLIIDGDHVEQNAVIINGNEVNPNELVIGGFGLNEFSTNPLRPGYQITDPLEDTYVPVERIPRVYDVGTPGTPISEFTYDEPMPYTRGRVAVVQRKYKAAIFDYSQENLTELEQAGAKVYAKFRNGTFREVQWSEVFDPHSRTGAASVNIAEIAEAHNQHFWLDTNGAHVTSDVRASWEDEYAERNHGTLAAPTIQNPWHNILLNSLGIMLRRGLINLVGIAKDNISFYDGTANDEDNITATFGTGGAQIGKNTENHVTITSEGVACYDSDGNLVPLRASNVEFGNARIGYLSVGYASILNGMIDSLTANDITAMHLNAGDIVACKGYIGHLESGTITANELQALEGFVKNFSSLRITTDYLGAHYATIDNLESNYATISHLESDYIDSDEIAATYATISQLESDYIDADTIVSRYATISQLESDYIDAEEIEATYATISHLETDYINSDEIAATYATISSLESDYIDADEIAATYATISALEADEANIDTLKALSLAALYADIDSLTADEIDALNLNAINAAIRNLETDNFTTENLTAVTALIDTLRAHRITTDILEANYADIGLANVNNAWIENGVIKNEAVTSAQIQGVSANKITAGELNADNIIVRNLQAANLKVGRINGNPVIGGYEVISTSISGYSSKNPVNEGWYEYVNNAYVLSQDTSVRNGVVYYKTADRVDLYDQATIDQKFSDVDARIDSQIETWTGTAVPLLTNYPANQWTSDSRADHVGDIYYVINTGNQYDGFTYRFAYDSTQQSYKWVLIRDNAVTDAISRIITAEGDIGTLKTFQSDTETWINETDDGLETIRSNHTSLEAVVDKTIVETTQLWFSKANTTAPSKPTSVISSTSTAGNAWRIVVPAYNASYPNYFYCYQWKYADGTYGWSAVTRDIAMGESQSVARTADATAKANIKSSVQLWFTKANTTAPAAPTAQVASTATSGNVWTTVVPTYNASYPYYFYCWQYQKGDNSYSWSTVVYDRATTENQQNSHAALTGLSTKVESTTFNSLVDTVGEHSSTITSLSTKVENLKIGGRNLLLWTENLPKGTDPSVTGKDGITGWTNSSTASLTETADGLKLSTTGASTECFAIPLATNGSVNNNEDVILSFEARGNITTVGQFYWIQASGSNVAINNWVDGSATISLNETNWTKFSINVKHDNANVRICTKILLFYNSGSSNNGKWIEIKKKSLKLEKGNKPTDWTPAPEDMATASSVTTVTNLVNTVQQTANSNHATIQELQTITSNLETAKDCYPNYWRVDRYSHTSRFTDSKIIPTEDDFISDNFIETKYIHEDNYNAALALGDKYIARIQIYIFMSETTSISLTPRHDDAAAYYLNGILIHSYAGVYTTTDSPKTVQFNAGWNKILILLNEWTGSEYAYFNGIKPSQFTNAVKVQAELDPYDDTTVRRRLSSVEQDLDGFRTTVSETYATSSFVDGLANNIENGFKSSLSGRNILTGNALDAYQWTVSAPSTANFTKEDFGTTGVKIAFDTVGGYENLYSPAIPVEKDRDYILIVEYITYQETKLTTSNKFGYGVGIYSALPSMGAYDNNQSTYLGKAAFATETVSSPRKAICSFTATTDTVYLMLNGGQIADGKHVSFAIDNLKLVAMDYAYGARNLAKTTGLVHSPDAYLGYVIYLSEKLKANTEYTLQLWDITLSHSGKQTADLAIHVYYCGGRVRTSLRIPVPNGTLSYYSGIIVLSESQTQHSDVTSASLPYIHLYNSVPNADGTRNMSIGRFKLEKGNKPTDWTPAPEDMATGAELATTNTNLTNEINQRKALYATSSTAAGTAAKDATCGNFVLYTGARVSVTFTNANTAATPTLNVNGTGAKQIRSYVGVTLDEGEYKWVAGSTLLFVYDGTYWRLQDSGSIKRLVTAETKIDQNAEAIVLRATKTEVSESIKGIKIGGRNLLRGTAIQDTSVGNYKERVEPTGSTLFGCIVFRSSSAWADIGFNFMAQVAGKVVPGDILTYSIWAKTDDTATRTVIGPMLNNGTANGGFNSQVGYKNPMATLTSQWQRLEATFTVTSAMIATGTAFRIECGEVCSSGTYIYWAAPKLEKGNKATDWDPAPEDSLGKMADYTPLKWLQGGANTRIDTTLKNSGWPLRMRTIVEFAADMPTNELDFWGNFNNQNGKFVFGTRQGHWYAYSGSGIESTINVSTDVKYDVTAEFTGGKCNIRVNTDCFTLSCGTTTPDDSLVQTIGLFSGRGDANYLSHSYAKIYEAQLYKQDSLVFDAVPVRRNSDGVLGMYDFVKDMFFPKQGDGSFTAGPEISWVEAQNARNKNSYYLSTAELKVTNDNISSKVSTTDYTGATIASKINQSADSVKIQAKHVEIDGTAIFGNTAFQTGLNNALDNIKIGGRNLIGNTGNPELPLGLNSNGTFGTVGKYNSPDSEFSIESYDASSKAIILTSTVTGNRGVGWFTKPGEIQAGETYTFSCKVKTSIAASIHMHTAWRNGSATAGYTGWTNTNGKTTTADTWTDYVAVFTPATNAQLSWEFYVAVCFSGNTSGITMRIAHAKLERGNKATDWTPAPEDVINYADSLVDNLNIGGTNLFLKSSELDSIYWTLSECTISGGHPDADGGNDAYLLTPSASSWWFNTRNGSSIYNRHLVDDSNVGKEFTYSVWLRADTTTTTKLNVRHVFGKEYHDTTATRWTITIPTNWTRFVFTGTLTTKQTNTSDNWWIGQAGSNPIYIYHPKLEFGNKATDWSPAPEDLVVNIGGRNLLLGTSKLKIGNNTTVLDKNGISTWIPPINSSLSETAEGLKLNFINNTSRECFLIPLVNNGSVGNNEDAILSFEARGNITSVGSFYWIQASGKNIVINNWLNNSSTISLSETEWRKFSTNVKSADANIRTCTQILMFYNSHTANANKWIELKNGSVKLELGTQATEWSPAPEDVTNYADSLVDNLKIGGRNLLQGTSDWTYGLQHGTKTSEKYMGLSVATMTGDNTNNYRDIGLWGEQGYLISRELEPSKEYTLSFWAKASVATSANSFLFSSYTESGYNSSGNTTVAADGLITNNLTTSWSKYWVTWKTKPTGAPTRTICLRLNKGNTATVYICGAKLEEGNKATDWSPAPEDMATTTALSTEINQRKAAYGTCSTAAGTQTKDVACANFEYVAGNSLTVYFSTANSYASGAVNLNVNGKGAKAIIASNATTSASNQFLWGAGAYITFRYTGSAFMAINEPRVWYGLSNTAAATAAKTDTTACTGAVICKGTSVVLGMTYDNTNTAPTLNIQSTGAKAVYIGPASTRPTKANGFSWLPDTTVKFDFDGASWRIGGDTYIKGDHIITGTIDANVVDVKNIKAERITSGKIKASQLQITDMTNYCQLNEQTASAYGYTVQADSNASQTPWFVRNNLGRDSYVSEWFDCRPGESFKVSAEVSSSAKGETTNGGTNSVYMNIHFGINTLTSAGTNNWPTTKIVTSSESAPATYVSGVVSASTDAVKFRAFLRINGYPPFTGSLKVRKLMIQRMANGELIVDGSITAGKITANAVTADKIAANAVTAGKIAANAVTADKINASAVTADKIAASAVTAGKIAAGTITSDKLATKTLTVGNFTDAAASSILNSNIQVGGRNLVKNTSNEWVSYTLTNALNSCPVVFSQTNLVYTVPNMGVSAGDKLMISFDIQMVNVVATSSGTNHINIQGSDNNGGSPWHSIFAGGQGGTNYTETFLKSLLPNGSAHVEVYLVVTQGQLDGTYTGNMNCNIRFDYYTGTVKIRNVKLEKGDKATDWTPAPEDTNALINTAQTTANNAAKTATDYVAAISGGVKIFPSGGASTNYLSITSNGTEVVKGGNSVASFGETVEIGRLTISKSKLQYQSVISGNGSMNLTYNAFEIRNMIDSSNSNITEYFVSDGKTSQYYLAFEATSTSYTVKVNGSTVSPTKSKTSFTFATASIPANSAKITVTYTPNANDPDAYYFAFGRSKVNTTTYLPGVFSLTSGYYCTANGAFSSSLGYNNVANGASSLAEGEYTTSTGRSSHAEGSGATAIGAYAHAEGRYTTASGQSSHAEGDHTTASGLESHAEGCYTTASGEDSHAEGFRTTASGQFSHACGHYTTASRYTQFVCGHYNSNTSGNLFEIGNGTSSTKSNAFSVTSSGTAYVGSTQVTSDERVKTDISELDIDDAYEFISELKPKSYKKFDRPELGFIAQDVEKLVYGDILVDESPNFGYEDFKNLSYEGLIAPIVAVEQGLMDDVDDILNHVNILKAENDRLKQENKELTKKNHELESRLERIESMLGIAH